MLPFSKDTSPCTTVRFRTFFSELCRKLVGLAFCSDGAARADNPSSSAGDVQFAAGGDLPR